MHQPACTIKYSMHHYSCTQYHNNYILYTCYQILNEFTISKLYYASKSAAVVMAKNYFNSFTVVMACSQGLSKCQISFSSIAPEEVGHIIICTALHQSLNTWPLQPIQPTESADHNLPMSKTIHTDIIRNVRLIIIQ